MCQRKAANVLLWGEESLFRDERTFDNTHVFIFIELKDAKTIINHSTMLCTRAISINLVMNEELDEAEWPMALQLMLRGGDQVVRNGALGICSKGGQKLDATFCFS